MKIELDISAPDKYLIQAYSGDGIVINKTLYQNSVIVSPDRIIENWAPQSFSELCRHHFNEIIDLSPEIVLIGTGKRLQFPDNDILVSMMGQNIGVEVMDTGAACRAYNFIAGEGRIVVAALLRIDP
jgi:uncharacterized protein